MLKMSHGSPKVRQMSARSSVLLVVAFFRVNDNFESVEQQAEEKKTKHEGHIFLIAIILCPPVSPHEKIVRKKCPIRRLSANIASANFAGQISHWAAFAVRIVEEDRNGEPRAELARAPAAASSKALVPQKQVAPGVTPL